jgi:hypothetical protein
MKAPFGADHNILSPHPDVAGFAASRFDNPVPGECEFAPDAALMTHSIRLRGALGRVPDLSRSRCSTGG